MTDLRILFVNRMAGMERGGGETFDLEIARNLAGLGCQITFLSGRPVFSEANLGAEEWWGSETVEGVRLKVEVEEEARLETRGLRRETGEEEERPETGDLRPEASSNVQRSTFNFQLSSGVASELSSEPKSATSDLDSPATCNLQPATPSNVQRSTLNAQLSSGGASDSSSQSKIQNPKSKIERSQVSSLRSRVFFLRSPWLGWFPWDKVRGGWRVRLADFVMFEYLAARWAWRHRGEFDVIQVCELPFFVRFFKKREASCRRLHHVADCALPVVMRLTAPDAYDPRGSMKLVDALIASGTTVEKVRTRIRSDCYNIPNGVDLEQFGVQHPGLRDQAAEFRKVHGIPASAPVLLYVARFHKFKNHELLLRAFRLVADRFPDARLVLAGSGPLLPEIKQQAASAGGKVVFLGETTFHDLPAIYAAADIKVISSEYESFCFTAIEAMAGGLPIVTTDCGWVTKLIGDETPPMSGSCKPGREPSGRFETEEAGRQVRRAPGGLVASRVDVASFAEAIMEMIASESLRVACGKWNRAKAFRDHGWASSARQLKAVYEGLLAGGDRIGQEKSREADI